MCRGTKLGLPLTPSNGVYLVPPGQNFDPRKYTKQISSHLAQRCWARTSGSSPSATCRGILAVFPRALGHLRRRHALCKSCGVVRRATNRFSAGRCAIVLGAAQGDHQPRAFSATARHAVTRASDHAVYPSTSLLLAAHPSTAAGHCATRRHHQDERQGAG